jgi:hypothetical protein
MTSGSNAFLDDFAGSWTCGNASYHSAWRIEPAPGKSEWAEVSYGEPQAPAGIAFVGPIEQEKTYVYNDFHTDGSLARLSSPVAVDHVWIWTGTYYPQGKAADPTPYITWTLTPKGTIERHFAQRMQGKTIDRGSDTCSRTQI